VADLPLETILTSLVAPSTPGRLVAPSIRRRGPSVEEAATQLQSTMEETVAQDWDLLNMARKAFTSLTRAYTTYPAAMKAMLSVRSLHLGHYAKSLCLRETPTALGRWRGESGGATGGTQQRKRFERRASDALATGRSRVRIPQSSDLGEFQSGLQSTAPKRKKKKVKKS